MFWKNQAGAWISQGIISSEPSLPARTLRGVVNGGMRERGTDEWYHQRLKEKLSSNYTPGRGPLITPIGVVIIMERRMYPGLNPPLCAPTEGLDLASEHEHVKLSYNSEVEMTLFVVIIHSLSFSWFSLNMFSVQ